MRIHCVGLPHVKMDTSYPDCAFTQRLLRFSEMMTQRGHDVFLYGVPGATTPVCAEMVECLHPTLQEEMFEDGAIHGDDPTLQAVCWFNDNVIKSLRERLEPQDPVILTWGWPQLAVANAFPDHLFIEGAIGYGSRVLPHAVFDTYAWMHYMYGKQGETHGKFFDTAILGPFKPEQFLPVEAHEEYLLYIGRLIPEKGIGIAQSLAEIVDLPLYVCGRGDESLLTSDKVNYMGVVNFNKRAELLQHATALVAPTQYIEPGGQVVVEATMAGVPAITTDFGCFTETVNSVTGWRCRIMSEFGIAATLARRLPLQARQEIQAYGESVYGYDNVGEQWENYLLRCLKLFGPGFYG